MRSISFCSTVVYFSSRISKSCQRHVWSLLSLQKCFTVSKSSAKRYLFYFFGVFFCLFFSFFLAMSKEAFCLVIFCCWVYDFIPPCLFHWLIGSFVFLDFGFSFTELGNALFWFRFYHDVGSESFLTGHSYKLLQVQVPHLLQCFSIEDLKRSQKL